MKLLLLAGNFPKKNYSEILNNSIGSIQYAADIFQWNLISGFNKKLNSNFYLVSAPFINAFPFGYKKLFYKKKFITKNEIYVGFLNLWGIRNYSRQFNLIRSCKPFLKEKGNKYVIVYSPHVPLLKCAYYLKKKDPTVQIILLVPDLPQFVALSEKQSIIYRLLKKIDIKEFYHYSSKFDKYILLTKQMNDVININFKKYVVIEGIVDDQNFNYDNINLVDKKNNKYIISYTGTLNKRYGICTLIDAFEKITSNKYNLYICGCGDAEEYVKEKSRSDKRIHYFGQVGSVESKRIQIQSDLLINPRQNIEEFTKYSFPSKNLEYLSTGNPVIAYKLDGIPSEYDKYLFYPKNNSVDELKNIILNVSKLDKKELIEYRKKVKKFIESKNIINTTEKIINFIINE